jgi:hypothetical protein
VSSHSTPPPGWERAGDQLKGLLGSLDRQAPTPKPSTDGKKELQRPACRALLVLVAALSEAAFVSAISTSPDERQADAAAVASLGLTWG